MHSRQNIEGILSQMRTVLIIALFLFQEMIMSLHSHKNYVPSAGVLTSHPSLVQTAALMDRGAEAGVRLALASAVAALKTNGSQGIYAEVHVGDRNTVERYNRLGMMEQPRIDSHRPEELVLVARTI
jgi:hypothetical protein